MSETLQPARAVAPGEIIELELVARGWSQRDLAEIMGRPPQAISEIIRGVKQITPETALELALAFDTSPELWSNLEASFRLQQARHRNPQPPLQPLADRRLATTGLDQGGASTGRTRTSRASVSWRRP